MNLDGSLNRKFKVVCHGLSFMRIYFQLDYRSIFLFLVRWILYLEVNQIMKAS